MDDLKDLLRNHITTVVSKMCRQVLPDSLDINVEGLIGITVGGKNVLLLRINDDINRCSDSANSNSNIKYISKRKQNRKDILHDEDNISCHSDNCQSAENKVLINLNNAEESLPEHVSQMLGMPSKSKLINRAVENVAQQIELEERMSPFRVGDKWLCQMCNKQFTTSVAAVNHMQIHTANIQTSKKRATTPDKLIDSTDDPDNYLPDGRLKPYDCAECHKRFISRTRLLCHQRVHSGEKPYSCTICNRRFTQKVHLRTHIRVHTGERPYECPVCSKRFSQKVHMQRHNRVHTGERPYQCPLCPRTFSQKVHVRGHMKNHAHEVDKEKMEEMVRKLEEEDDRPPLLRAEMPMEADASNMSNGSVGLSMDDDDEYPRLHIDESFQSVPGTGTLEEKI